MSLSPKVDKSLSHQIPNTGTDQVARIERLRAAAKVFAEAIEANVGEPADATGITTSARKPSRESSLAVTNLEQSLMWAVKGVVLE